MFLCRKSAEVVGSRCTPIYLLRDQERKSNQKDVCGKTIHESWTDLDRVLRSVPVMDGLTRLDLVVGAMYMACS